MYIIYICIVRYVSIHMRQNECFWLQATAKHIFKRIDLQGTGRFQVLVCRKMDFLRRKLPFL